MKPEYSHNLKTNPVSDMGMDSDFGLMYDFYKPKLFVIVNAYIPSKEDAEEIVHDVLIKLWEKRDTLQIRSNFTGYVYSMTRNASLDYLRKQKNKLTKEMSTEQQEFWLNHGALADDAASSILAKELESLVDSAIEKLPEKCRMVFKKSRLDGLCHKEISEELDISSKTVENHISRALRQLRTVLADYLPSLFL
ncbi:RNA polymerase sigma-70 factor [Muricauda sp. 334s03]|uniref:RNA polymerase sigma-70 factor n=1 Tax=Flagellimonas yonaguniensis TaxID=3031325 RepID=A0ABT5Y3S2_9FLAO|nr:RNA polymerase sigma-70 factor [[Muricauda] yonaguniensis]MDF0718096.1 RNA polymerase sigma-70 factor [[Muricauda] yonaguniensis]